MWLLQLTYKQATYTQEIILDMQDINLIVK